MTRLPPSFAYDTATHHLQLSPQDATFVQDPYPVYAHLHAQSAGDGPVFYWQQYNHWVFGGLDAVNALFREKRLGRAPLQADTPQGHRIDWDNVDAHSLLELEPPDHTRLRGLINRAFVSRHVEALGPEIEAETVKAMDGFGDTADLIADFAQPIAGNVIARMLGIDVAHVPQLLAWSNTMVRMYAHGRDRGIEEAANTAARAFSSFVRGEIAQRRAEPGADLLSHLISAHEDQDRLSEQEIISTTILLLNAGHEATVHTTGNGLRTLLQADAETRSTWVADPAALVEEVLRHSPPLHMFMRFVKEDCTLYGVPLKRGDTIGLHLGLANHDPRASANPETFDPARTPIKNVAFGAGIHFCIGHTLARLEMETSIPMLFARFPGMAISEEPRVKNAYHFHGLESLQVTV